MRGAGEAADEAEDRLDALARADPLDDRRADHRAVGDRGDPGGGLRRPDAEADADRQRRRRLDPRDLGPDGGGVAAAEPVMPVIET